MKIHVGTSGWNFGHWKGVFYPEKMRTADWLAFYAQRLGTLELNVTFYRQVKAETFRKWRGSVPEGFLFSVKMSRYLTHTKRLKTDQPTVARFLENVTGLTDKLGVILIQLPPSLKFDAPLMEDFLALLDPALRYTVEARNESFVTDPFFQMLEERNIAWCISESAGRYPYSEALTADFVYMRLHGREELYASSYKDDELLAIKEKLTGWGKEAFVYFDNDFGGHAPNNALTLKAMASA